MLCLTFFTRLAPGYGTIEQIHDAILFISFVTNHRAIVNCQVAIHDSNRNIWYRASGKKAFLSTRCNTDETHEINFWLRLDVSWNFPLKLFIGCGKVFFSLTCFSIVTPRLRRQRRRRRRRRRRRHRQRRLRKLDEKLMPTRPNIWTC